MAHKWRMRLLSAILCLALLLADVPAGWERAAADDGAAIVVEEVISEEIPSEAPGAEDVSEPEAEPATDPVPAERVDSAQPRSAVPEAESASPGAAKPDAPAAPELIAPEFEEVEPAAPELVADESLSAGHEETEVGAPELVAPAPEAEEQTEVSFEASALGAPALLAEGDAATVASAAIVPSVERLTLGLGETATIGYTRAPNDSSKAVAFASSNPNIAAVNETSGEVTAKKIGSATITLSDGEASASVAVAVKAAPAGVALRVDGENAVHAFTAGADGERQLLLGQGDNVTLAASILPASASGAIAWSPESDANFAIAAEGDKLTIAANADATPGATLEVTAAARNWADGADVSDKCVVRVLPAPRDADLQIHIEKTALKVGQTAKLRFGFAEGSASAGAAFTCAVEGKTSKGASVAAYDAATGILTAKSAGTATITMTAYNGAQARATVRVTSEAPPTSISMTLPKAELIVGESMKVTTASKPSGSRKEIEISFSEEGIASYDKGKGALTALRPGDVTVIATSYNYDPANPDANLRIERELTIQQKVTAKGDFRVALQEGSREILCPGETAQLQVEFADESGRFPGDGAYQGAHFGGAVSWSASPKSVATVKGGKVTSVAPGVATVTASVAGVKNAYRIHVLKKATVAFARENGKEVKVTHLSQGETATVKFQLGGYTAAASDDVEIPADGLFTFATSGGIEISEPKFSSDGKIATLTVTATEGSGTAKLTAKVPGGASKALSIALSPALESIAPAPAKLHLLPGASATIQAALNPAKSNPNLAWSIAPDDGLLKITKSSGNQITVKLDSAAKPGAQYTVACAARNCLKDGAPVSGAFELTAGQLPDETAGDFGTIAFTKEPSADSTVVAIGEGESMTASVDFRESYAGTATWKIAQEDAGRATVDKKTGKVTGKKAGAEPVTLIAAVNGREIAAQFYVIRPVTKVAFENSAGKLTLGVGERFTLGSVITGYEVAEGTIGATPNLNDGKTYSFTSSNSAVARVDAITGEITALKAGAATVALKAYNAASKSACKKTVAVTVKKGLGENFALAPEGAVLAKGDALTIQANLGGGYAELEWSAEPEGAVVLNKKSNAEREISVGGASAGDVVTVTAAATRLADGRQATATIRVVDAYLPGDFQIDAPGKAAIGVGESIALRAGASDENHGGAVTWKSDSKSATVNGSGVVTGKKTGSATITATAFNSTSSRRIADSKALKIIQAPTSLTCDGSAKPTIHLGAGETQALTLKVGGYSGGETTGGFYKASDGKLCANANEEAVAVDEGELPGLNRLKVTGVAPGTSKLTVKAYNGKSIVLTVNVLPKPAKIALPESLMIAAGETLTLDAALLDESGAPAYANLTWPEADELVWSGTEEKSGFAIQAVDNDTVRITAPEEIAPEHLNDAIALTVRAEGYADDIPGATCKIEVVKAPVEEEMELSGIPNKLGVGETATGKFTFAEGCQVPDELREVSFSSSDKSIAAVRAIPVEGKPGEYDIEITAKKTGKATIAAKAARNGAKVSVSVTVAKAPTSVTITVDGEKNPAQLTMGVAETLPISFALPSGSAGRVDTSFEPEGIVELRQTEDGGKELVALTTGETVLTVAAYNGTAREIEITVRNMPTAITVDEGRVVDGAVVLGVGDSVNLGAKLDAGSAGKITYAVPEFQPENAQHKLGDLLSYDQSGKVTAKAPGTATIQISTYAAANVTPVAVHLTIKRVPTDIAFDDTNYYVLLDGSAPLNLREKVALTRSDGKDCAASLTFSVTKNKNTGKCYIDVDEDGNVTPSADAAAGRKNTVTVKTHNGKEAKATVWVLSDLDTPQIIERLDTPGYKNKVKPIGYLYEGESYTPALYFFPKEAANCDMKWTASGATDSVSLNKTSGKVTAKSAAHKAVTITGKSVANPDLAVSYKLYVLTDERETEMPMRHYKSSNKSKYADVIANNRAQMNLVIESARYELDKLVATGKISALESDTRKDYIKRAFAMYDFPWCTNTTVPYWRAANSINGAKDFKNTYLYFGIPYTQTNRNYDKGRISGYFSEKSDGYNVATSAFTKRGRDYPGSDCSSFVSMAIWASTTGRGRDNTSAIARASYYKTISDWNSLRPGDLICKGGSHVVMFLYYANESKSKLCIIEQGGTEGDDFTNCVSPYIYTKSHFRDGGYKIRRVKSLA